MNWVAAGSILLVLGGPLGAGDKKSIRQEFRIIYHKIAKMSAQIENGVVYYQSKLKENLRPSDRIIAATNYDEYTASLASLLRAKEAAERILEEEKDLSSENLQKIQLCLAQAEASFLFPEFEHLATTIEKYLKIKPDTFIRSNLFFEKQR